MSESINPQSVTDVESMAAKAGITFTPEDYAEAERRAIVRRQQLEAEMRASEKPRSMLERINQAAPVALQSLINVGNLLYATAYTLIVAFGAGAVLLIVLGVEQWRVLDGLVTIGIHPEAAPSTAWALVIANVTLEAVIHWLEYRVKWVSPARYEFSFRLLSQRIVYLAGRDSGWSPRPKSPAQAGRVLLRFVTWAILVLAVGGSMQGAIVKVGGNWLQAIAAILTESTLAEMFSWLGGGLLSAALVLIAQYLARFVSERAVEAFINNKVADRLSAIAQEATQTAAAYLFGRAKDLQKQRRAASSAATLEREYVMPVSSVSTDVETGETRTASGETGIAVSSVSSVSPALKRALEWLETHPEFETASLSEVAEVSGLSRSSVQRARSILKSR